jgi:UDP:flavonoid glycosyltransferase YjiC (YdhE family)
MSTTIFLNMPHHGHINPTLPLIAELVHRGERVIYYATKHFEAKIQKTGAEFRDYGRSEQVFDPTQDLGGPFGLMAASIDATERLLPRLLAEIRAEQPAYLLVDSMCVWGNLLQQILACPAVTSCSTFVLSDATLKAMRSSGAPKPPFLSMLKTLPLLLRYFWVARRLDQRYGTRSPGLTDFFINRQALNLVYTSHLFQPNAADFDESYKFVGPSVAPRHETTDFPLDQLGLSPKNRGEGEVRGGLHPPQTPPALSAPLIYISLGTIFNAATEFYRACFRAFGDSPYQVVMSIGTNVDPQALGTPPDNFIVRPYVPQLDILERAALFISHGGMNSVSESLLYGVPLLVVPQVGDQFVVAGRLAALRAGLTVSPAQATPEQLRALAGQILAQPGFKQQAQAIGESLRTAGGYQRAADEIFAFKARLGLPA